MRAAAVVAVPSALEDMARRLLPPGARVAHGRNGLTYFLYAVSGRGRDENLGGVSSLLFFDTADEAVAWADQNDASRGRRGLAS